MTPRGLPGIRSIQTKPFLLHAVGLICSQRCQEEYICQAPSTETFSCCYASFLSATLPIAHILCISTSAEWVMHMKGAAFPAEMPLILGIRCLTLVCFIPALQHPPAFWFGSLASYHCRKFFTHCPSLCLFISMYAPAPPKAILALYFLSRAPCELASAKQS